MSGHCCLTSMTLFCLTNSKLAGMKSRTHKHINHTETNMEIHKQLLPYIRIERGCATAMPAAGLYNDPSSKTPKPWRF